MTDEPVTLDEVWRVRNAAAVTLGLCEDQMRRAVRTASVDQLTGLIETFAPGRSTGPDWTRTFEPLVERLWAWCDDASMAALEACLASPGGQETAAHAFAISSGGSPILLVGEEQTFTF